MPRYYTVKLCIALQNQGFTGFLAEGLDKPIFEMIFFSSGIINLLFDSSLLVFFLAPSGLGKILRNSQNIRAYYMLNLLNHRIRCIYFYFVGGIVLGGVVVRRFNLKKSCRLSAKYCLIFQALSVWTAAAFIIPGCDEVNLAGVVKPYFKGYEEFQMLI